MVFVLLLSPQSVFDHHSQIYDTCLIAMSGVNVQRPFVRGLALFFISFPNTKETKNNEIVVSSSLRLSFVL